MSEALNVVQLNPLCGDVAAQLRRLANQVEEGEFGDRPSAVLVIQEEDYQPELFGWGAADHMRATYLLGWAMQIMYRSAA